MKSRLYEHMTPAEFADAVTGTPHEIARGLMEADDTLTARTPGPWTACAIAGKSGRNRLSINVGNRTVAQAPIFADDDRANVAHIVTACNAHDALAARVAELEAALRDCITAMRNGAPGRENRCAPHRTLAYQNARAALKGKP